MPSSLPRRLVPSAAAGLTAVLGLCACSTGQPAGNGDSVSTISGKISLTYLQKQGDQQYFIDEAAGAKAKAAELGIDLKVVNLGTDANKAVGEAQSAIAQKTNGLITVLPDPSVGPQVVQTAKDAKVALLTSDDQVCSSGPEPAACAHQDLVPRVGFSGEQMGQQVGKEAAALFKQSGWNAADTRIISAWQQDVSVCSDRVKAADEEFAADAAARVQVIDVATDNTPTGAQDKVSATMTANQGVKHWILWGCNDENVQGGVTALQNGGVSPDNIIGVGLGAYLACKDWGSGKPSGMKAALFINGKDVGALAVQTMYDKLKNGKDFPQEAFAPTKMVDPGNWQTSGLSCT
ncbi:substrate-binding domain-containing protein [Kitasatospora sp. NPDC006697]|uniref:substrate-binding domain-containing protein n=1 Tax=Kitasatospora sp. NPDC006697 TaxID=3364020 RepID=UPI00367A3C5A